LFVPKHQTSIVVTEGKVDTSVLRYKEDADDQDGENSSD
jgi:hypothetical protein